MSTRFYTELYWTKQLHTLPVLHFNRCLKTEYSETTAHFNGNSDTDNQIYVIYNSLSAQRLSERTVLHHYSLSIGESKS
jgi:hypothetical protein